MPFVESYNSVYGNTPRTSTPTPLVTSPTAPNATSVATGKSTYIPPSGVNASSASSGLPIYVPPPPTGTSTPVTTRLPGESVVSLTNRVEPPIAPQQTGPAPLPQGVKAPPGYEYDGKGGLVPITNTPTSPTPAPTPQPTQTSAEARAKAIEEQKKELEPAGGAPTPFMSAEEFKKLRDEQGIVQDENEWSSIKNEAAIAQQALREFKQTSTEGLSMGGYLGGISEAERNLNFRLEGLAIRERAVVDRINLKNSFINSVLKFGGEDYDRVYKQYQDTWNNNYKAVSLYNQQLDDEQKDALAGFTTVANLFKDRNITEISPEMKTQMNQLEIKAGLPMGIFEQAMSSMPDEKILSPIISEDANGNKSVHFFTQDANGTPHLKATKSLSGGMGGGTGTGGEYSTSDPQYAATANTIRNAVNNLRFSSVEESKRVRGNIDQMLSRGDLIGAESVLRDFGYQKLSQTQKAQYDSYANSISAFGAALEQMNDPDLIAGPYKSLYESSKPWLTMQQDKSYVDLRAMIELGQAQIRRGFFGTAITPSEAASAARFIVQDSDPLDTMKWKIESAMNFITWVNDATVARAVNLDVPELNEYLNNASPEGGLAPGSTFIEDGYLWMVGTNGTAEAIGSATQ